MFFATLSLVLASAFFGAAIYVTLVEQPARLKLESQALLTEFQHSYPKAAVMQAPLALLSGLAGLLSFWSTAQYSVFIGALLMLANIPYTLIVIMPLNKTLLALPLSAANAKTREMLIEWGKLHRVRSVMSLIAVLLLFPAHTHIPQQQEKGL